MYNTDFNYDRVEQAIEYLVGNFKNQPDLNEVSDHVHVSAQHFQRIFNAKPAPPKVQVKVPPAPKSALPKSAPRKPLTHLPHFVW